jgi:hypothetical protein
MIRLCLPKEPYWLDLPFGVRLRVRPLTTATYEAARIKGWRKARAVAREFADLKAVGGDISGLPDLRDDDAVAGFSQLLFAQALARAAILEWEGVLEADGAPAAVSDTNVADLMLIQGVAEAFVGLYTAPHEAVLAEGNASRPAADGTSAAGRDIAASAATTAPPAPVTEAVPPT